MATVTYIGIRVQITEDLGRLTLIMKAGKEKPKQKVSGG